MAVLPSFLLLSFLAAAAAAPNRPFITQYPLQNPPAGLQVKRVLLNTELVKRSGLMDNILERLSPKAGSRNSPPKMSQIHRLPQPPKYPLYDMPSIGMATPPPAPLLSPMSLMPSEYYGGMGGGMGGNYGGFQQGGGNNYGASSNHYESTLPRDLPKRRGGPASPFRANRRNHQGGPPPQQQQRQPQQGGGRGRRPRPPARGKKGQQQGPKGFDHPMASNINAVSSPPLGRPLGYEEYMKRPNHAYTQDPWNFDPMRTQNTMPHTDGLKYNYDPLGMNALESAQGSHLDPQKMSYPGDYFTNQFESPGEQAQWGGWDKQGQAPSQTPMTYDKYASNTNAFDKSSTRYDTIGQYSSNSNSRDDYGDLFNSQDSYSSASQTSGKTSSRDRDRDRDSYRDRERDSYSTASRREQQSVEPYSSGSGANNDFRSALDSYLDGSGSTSDIVRNIETLGPAVEDRVATAPDSSPSYSTIPSNYDESYFTYSDRERERDRERNSEDADRPFSDPISDSSSPSSYSSHYGSPTSYELPTQEPKGHGNAPLSDTYNPYDDQENFASRYARKSSYYGAPKKGERKENSNSYVILKPEDLVLERVGGGNDEGLSILKEFINKDSEVARSLMMAIS